MLLAPSSEASLRSAKISYCFFISLP